LCKYFQDEKGTVIDRKLQETLQIALLAWTQTLVKQDFLGTQLGGEKLDFIRLTGANKQRRIGRFALTSNSGNWR
jgi:hypothetical protein